MATRYDHVARTNDQPSGIETLNRLGGYAKDLLTEFGKRHSVFTGTHDCPEIARLGGYVQQRNGVPLLHQSFGNIAEVTKMGTGRYRLSFTGRPIGIFSQLKVTPIGGFAVPVTYPVMGGRFHEIRLYQENVSGVATRVDRDFVFQMWHEGQSLQPSPMQWTNRALDRVWGASTANTIAYNLRKWFDLFGVAHTTSSGATNDPGVSLGGGYVSESAGTYTLEEKYGFVNTITKLGTGDVRVNLSSSMQADGSDYWYRPIVTAAARRNVVYAETLAASDFVVRLWSVGGGTQDGGFSFHMFGIAA